MKQLIIIISLFIAGALFSQHSFSQERVLEIDPVANIDSLLQMSDSLLLPPPSIPPSIPPADTPETDTIPTGRTILEATVQYSAQDSIVMFPRTRMGHLFGDAKVEYTSFTITGQYITTDMESNIISSTFGVDSLGQEFGLPVLTEGGTEYEMRAVRYNFQSRRAFIEHVVTQQGEGSIIANEAKRNPDNSFYMRNARYTTCPHHTHPHFYLNLSRAKVRPGRDVVTGPAWLVVADVPLFPIVLPFAFFPFTDTYSSGVIMPSYGEEMNRGFFLHNGGYYFAINDFIDAAATGEIYTKGSWGAGLRSNYRVRYKYSGNVDFYYRNTAYGDRDLKDIIPGAYYRSKDFRLNWTHSQDPKMNMFRTISGSVNFATSSYRRNDMSQLVTREGSNNTTSSSVNITQRFPNSPWNLSATMNVNQVSRDSTISATLPNFQASMNRISPFKRKNAVGAERWYEKITVNYSGEFRNSITTKEDRFFRSSLINDWTNGMQHRGTASATFSLFDFIQITPNFNYTERWYTGGVREAYDPVSRRHVVVDTVRSFSRVADYNTSISAQTRMYGMYVPWRIFGNKVEAIRHVFSPSVSLSYRPDFGDPRFGIYETYTYFDEFGEEVTHTYSPYRSMMFGAPGRGRQGNIGFDFKNNLEMKVRSDSDSLGSRKISLIDDLGVGFSYNMMAETFHWSTINTNVRLKLTRSYTLSLNASWDPYMWGLDERDRPQRIDRLRIMNGQGFGKLTSTGTSFSYALNQGTFGKLFSRGERRSTNSSGGNGEEGELLPNDGTIGRNPNEFETRSGASAGGGAQEFDSNGYLINPLNWNLSFNYSVRYANSPSSFDPERNQFRGMLTHNLGFSGSIQPTANWNFSFNSDYNFDLKKITNMNATITRRMCCWSMSASVIPMGPFQSYMFTIRADASLLQDLKYDQRNSPHNRGTRWY
jgi:hypothetical protein